MRNIYLITIMTVSIAVLFGGCNPAPDEQQSIAENNTPTPVPPTPTVSLTQSPTTAPTYTPGPPTATPMPSPAIFELLLNNFNMMTLDQRDQYIKELNGSEFHHWIGIVRDKPLLDDGYYGLSVEIDQNETERPDLVLINMDKSVLETLEKGQRFRFSGTFSGFINMNGILNLFAIDKVTVHQ